MSEPTENNLRDTLNEIGKSVDKKRDYNATEHKNQSRLEITKLFLKSYFALIAGSFIFTGLYNFIAAWLNSSIALTNPIKYLDLLNTVAIITTTLSSGVGFVFGYYFKNKEDES